MSLEIKIGTETNPPFIQHVIEYTPAVRIEEGLLQKEFSDALTAEAKESAVYMLRLQNLLSKTFYHLPSRNPERKPITIILGMNMDANSREYLKHLVKRYQQAQGVPVNIHQPQDAECDL